MISEKMQEAINAQINAEMWSAYLYLAMSVDASNYGMKGIAHWFQKQNAEEMEHAFKFMNYLESQFADIELRPIAEFPTRWGSPMAMFESALKHEEKVTQMIDNLYEMANNENDFATAVFLQWYITEQVEEEENVKTIIEHMKLIGDDAAALFCYDNELGTR